MRLEDFKNVEFLNFVKTILVTDTVPLSPEGNLIN